ncbi:hypothetical protein [Kiloniella sp.]|uniref:hypothetical protein n=1 Tax=Kiloniella sp. TaxID=1938587 RepID=UPI003B0250A9
MRDLPSPPISLSLRLLLATITGLCFYLIFGLDVSNASYSFSSEDAKESVEIVIGDDFLSIPGALIAGYFIFPKYIELFEYKRERAFRGGILTFWVALALYLMTSMVITLITSENLSEIWLSILGSHLLFLLLASILLPLLGGWLARIIYGLIFRFRDRFTSTHLAVFD